MQGTFMKLKPAAGVLWKEKEKKKEKSDWGHLNRQLLGLIQP